LGTCPERGEFNSMANPKIRTLLIDADIFMFKFGFRYQTSIEWGNSIVTVDVDDVRAKRDIDKFILSLLRRTNCADYTLCFTNQINFRYSVFPAYKANRVKNEKPKLLTILKDHMWKNHPCESWKYLEADDLMGVIGTHDPKRYVLATIDKDFESLPVTLFNWDKDKRPRKISKKQANYNFHYQWLKGDPVDGFKGVFGIGDKKARTILDARPQREWSAAVVETYADRCYSWKEIIIQARMARILRCTDYDFKKKKPILWTPNI